MCELKYVALAQKLHPKCERCGCELWLTNFETLCYNCQKELEEERALADQEHWYRCMEDRERED